jgi:hypothetical protein
MNVLYHSTAGQSDNSLHRIFKRLTGACSGDLPCLMIVVNEVVFCNTEQRTQLVQLIGLSPIGIQLEGL